VIGNPILVVLVFLATVLALEGVYLLVADRNRNTKARLKRRLAILSGRVRAGDLKVGSAETSILRSTGGGRRSFAERALDLLPNRESLDLLLYRAGTSTSPGHLLRTSVLLAAAGWIGASLVLRDPALGPLGLVLGLTPWLYMSRKAAKRLKEFEAQFPEALELLTRALRAGHSLATGFQLVGEEMPEPIALEFGLVAEEIKFGLDSRSALRNLAERVNNRDVPFFVTAVLIQRETGGNLAELLDMLAVILRERAKFYGKVRAMTAQGRMTANVLAMWPAITVALVSWTGSDYLEPLFTPEGYFALLGAIVFVIIGWLVARRLAEVKV
jgi:tight adherence protein B